MSGNSSTRQSVPFTLNPRRKQPAPLETLGAQMEAAYLCYGSVMGNLSVLMDWMSGINYVVSFMITQTQTYTLNLIRGEGKMH